MKDESQLPQQAITLMQKYIAQLGYRPVIHFELEGGFQSPELGSQSAPFQLDYDKINQQLKQQNIDGELVPEYWKNQWEYVSKFNQQTPLKEAHNLTQAMQVLPYLFAQQGIDKTLIKPVVWAGDNGKLVEGSGNIFTTDNRVVHIPNAVQINVSALNEQKDNIIVLRGFGEYLQQCFLQTSLACCLLYLPEEEAFERLSLKNKYGLAAELCSPNDISGGHQGSIALYKEVGKHNQAMGEEPLLYDQHEEVLLSQQNWQKTARIEHRLGASSQKYNAYYNIIYALLNLIDALDAFQSEQCLYTLTSHKRKHMSIGSLPTSLFDRNNEVGAISIFEQDTWLSESLNKISGRMNGPYLLGDKIKREILLSFQQPNFLF